MLGASFILIPMGFTPGIRPAPSARSIAGNQKQMISEHSILLMEQVEAHGSILHELKECNKIQSDNIQTLVSCPRDPRTFRSPQLSPKLRHLQDDICKDMEAYNEAIDVGFKSQLERLVLELHTPTALAPSSLPMPPFPSSPEGV